MGAPADTPLLRCRVTVGLAGGARPGDVVLIDPNDPWMASKIHAKRGPLVPLDPWPPAVAAETEEPTGTAPIEGDSPETQAGSGDDAASTPDVSPPAAEGNP